MLRVLHTLCAALAGKSLLQTSANRHCAKRDEAAGSTSIGVSIRVNEQMKMVQSLLADVERVFIMNLQTSVYINIYVVKQQRVTKWRDAKPAIWPADSD